MSADIIDLAAQRQKRRDDKLTKGALEILQAVGITWATDEDVRTVAGFLAQGKPRKPRGTPSAEPLLAG